MSEYYNPDQNVEPSEDEDDHKTDSGYAGSTDGMKPDVYAVNGQLDDGASSTNSLASRLAAGASSSTHRRSPSISAAKQAETHQQQLDYNRNRAALSRSIAAVLSMMKQLQMVNRDTDIYYPTEDQKPRSKKGKSKVQDDLAAMEGEEDIEPLAPVEQAPRLVSPQIERQLNVFKLDLKVGALSSDELVRQLGSSSVRELLDDRIRSTMNHLSKLRNRIEDTSSKVLITGDLNSGKSTFCNALLRRKLLPADQQPCTNVFCEVKDATDNAGVEEVHAVLIDVEYKREDAATYERHSLDKLDDLVAETEKYSILKVYVDDNRPVHQSLLRNGIVDISLIDAPGLNMDSYQTTQVFSQQEEIDLVVFVVSAENHFTLSAKEFITAAAHEKSFIFIVVNRFDQLQEKGKGKCMKRIMDQVKDLAPETHKDARDFVHFVSSENALNSMPHGGGGGDDGGDGDGDGDGDDGDPNPDIDPMDPRFNELEESLRNFVLEKRSLSKLAPAKTYLINTLTDLETLADVNVKVSQEERQKFMSDLNTITPQCEELQNQSIQVSDQVDKDIEEAVDDVYNHTCTTLRTKLTELGEAPVVQLTSYFDLLPYARATREALIQQIQGSVLACEDYARTTTARSVNALKSLGILHLGNKQFEYLEFNPAGMFSKKRDANKRIVKSDFSIADFFDVPVVGVLSFKDHSSLENALTLSTVVGSGSLYAKSDVILKAVGFMDRQTLKKIMLPVSVLAVVGALAYMVHEMPRTLPRNLSKKIRAEVESADYVHVNADRISKKCRTVLKYPAHTIRAGFQTNLEEQLRQKESCKHKAQQAEDALSKFSTLHNDAKFQRSNVEQVNLSVD